jgi:hypothetical protein
MATRSPSGRDAHRIIRINGIDAPEKDSVRYARGTSPRSPSEAVVVAWAQAIAMDASSDEPSGCGTADTAVRDPVTSGSPVESRASPGITRRCQNEQSAEEKNARAEVRRDQSAPLAARRLHRGNIATTAWLRRARSSSPMM